MIDEALVDQLPLFSGLNERARREVALRSSLVRRRPGQHFWRAGDPPKGVVILVEGTVRIVRVGGSGRRHVVHREGPGTALGEVPLLDGGGYPATAEAETPVTAVLVTGDAMEAAMAADPALARRLLTGLARRVRHLVDRLDALAVLDVRCRLARHLLDRANAGGGGAFDLGTSQAKLAEELGTVREVVVRNLGALRRRGVLESAGRGRYRLTNRPALEALAEG